MKIKLILTIVLCVIIQLFTSCVNSNEEQVDKTESKFSNDRSNNETPSITTILAIDSIYKKQIISNGKIEALNRSELRFKISERLASIEVKNGQRVSKGQILAILDNAILSNQLNKAKIELDKCKSKLEEEKINFGIGNTNIETIEPTILKNLKLNSGYYEAENTLENAQLLYNQTFLKAPFNGVVANVESKAGNYITSGDVFCTVIAQQKLEAVFSVLENELSFIQKSRDVSISSFVDENTSYKGVITEINPIVDENGLIKIKAKINTPDSNLFDGMHIKVIINQTISNVIVIPKEALVLRSNKEVVFTVEDGLAKWNYVEKLEENSTSYAIKKGLKLGDTIIISGNMNLAHDAKVNIK